jgi:hypothetical protein
MIMHHFAPFSQSSDRLWRDDWTTMTTLLQLSALVQAKPFLNERIYKDTEAEKTLGHEWFRMKRG